MIPIFFPFTRIPEPIQNPLFACFDRIVVYSPHPECIPTSHRDLKDKGLLEIRVLEEEVGDKLPTLLKSYHAWARLHRGERPDFHKFSTRQTTPPQDPPGTEIRSQILKTDRNTPSREDKGADLLLKARVFLAFAQQYDEHQESLSRDLSNISAMQRDLLQHLTPDREQAPSIKPDTHLSESAEILRPMAAERLAAWSRLYVHHCRQMADGESDQPLPPFLVTSEPDVFHLLKGTEDSAEVVCHISDIPLTGQGPSPGSKAVGDEIHRMLSMASEGTPLSRVAEFSLSDNQNRLVNAAALTIFRKRGDIITSHLSSLDGAEMPCETSPPFDENACTLVGCITRKLYA